MAIALGNTSQVSGYSNTTSDTLAHDNGSGDYLFVGVAHGSEGVSADPSGVTYNGVSMTRLDSNVFVTAARRLTVWGLVAPAAGSNDVVVTYASALDGLRRIMAVSWTGVNQSTPIGTLAANSAAPGAITVDASSAAGEVVVDFFVAGRNTVELTGATAGAGQTEALAATASGGAATGSFSGCSYESGAASVTMSWTVSGGTDVFNIINAIPLKPAGGGPTTTLMGAMVW